MIKKWVNWILLKSSNNIKTRKYISIYFLKFNLDAILVHAVYLFAFNITSDLCLSLSSWAAAGARGVDWVISLSGWAACIWRRVAHLSNQLHFWALIAARLFVARLIAAVNRDLEAMIPEIRVSNIPLSE